MKLIGSVLIKFISQQEIKVPGCGEGNLYALVLEVLRKNDKNLAKVIHDSKKETPLTISPLLKGAKSLRGYSILFPERTASFRITYLEEKIFEPLIQGFLSFVDKREALKFSEGEILIERVDWQQGKKASFTSFEEIFSLAQDKRKVILEFCSPTTFGDEEGQLFPLPELVFSSLLKKWNTFSDVKIPSLQGEFKKIRVAQHRLKTEIVPFSDNKIIGFMGKATYELADAIEKENRRAINALSDFAFYSGIGDKTHKGMGQARRLINPDNTPENINNEGKVQDFGKS